MRVRVSLCACVHTCGARVERAFANPLLGLASPRPSQATSALDVASERVVQAALDALVVGRTTVVSANPAYVHIGLYIGMMNWLSALCLLHAARRHQLASPAAVLRAAPGPRGPPEPPCRTPATHHTAPHHPLPRVPRPPQVVAHRLSTIKDADIIAVVKEVRAGLSARSPRMGPCSRAGVETSAGSWEHSLGPPQNVLDRMYNMCVQHI